MGPIITPLNITRTLLNPVIINGNTVATINLTALVKMPVLKKIVFVIENTLRIEIYSGETEYNDHENDSQSTLITKLLEVIDTTYPHA